MTDCEFSAGCGSFSRWLSDNPGTGALFKRHYCEGDPKSCARYAFAEQRGPHGVPDDLMPNQHDRLNDEPDTGAIGEASAPAN